MSSQNRSDMEEPIRMAPSPESFIQEKTTENIMNIAEEKNNKSDASDSEDEWVLVDDDDDEGVASTAAPTGEQVENPQEEKTQEEEEEKEEVPVGVSSTLHMEEAKPSQVPRYHDCMNSEANLSNNNNDRGVGVATFAVLTEVQEESNPASIVASHNSLLLHATPTTEEKEREKEKEEQEKKGAHDEEVVVEEKESCMDFATSEWTMCGGAHDDDEVDHDGIGEEAAATAVSENLENNNAAKEEEEEDPLVAPQTEPLLMHTDESDEQQQQQQQEQEDNLAEEDHDHENPMEMEARDRELAELLTLKEELDDQSLARFVAQTEDLLDVEREKNKKKCLRRCECLGASSGFHNSNCPKH